MPTYLPARLQAAMAMDISSLTAGSRSSKRSATRPESRSRASVNCVRSLEPIENPSTCSRNASALIAFEGTSHIMMTSSPFSPRRRP